MNSSVEDMYSELAEPEDKIRVYRKLQDIAKFNKTDFDSKKRLK